MFRGGSRAAATSKMECFVIIVNDWKPLTIITKCSILDVAAALDPPQMLPHLASIRHYFFKLPPPLPLNDSPVNENYFKMPNPSFDGGME